MHHLIKLLFLLLICNVHRSESYSKYRDDIPNGMTIPDPCNNGSLWSGVGHWSSSGGGSRNQFGIDFATAGRKWSKELCNKDSDGDGKSNGQELGDPDCEWTKGKTPNFTTGLSHPGVCEPVESDKCKTRNLKFGPEFCMKQEECEGMKNTKVMKLTFTRTEVPTAVTNYYCQAFEVNETMYVYASEMGVDNANVIHHALLFGCKSKPNDDYFQKPNQCYMNSGECNEIISLWTVGHGPDCLNKDLHFALGPNQTFQYVILQYHWNNPQQRSGMFDSSTMKLYYGDRPRKYSAGVVMAGQIYLNLPAGQKSVTRTSISGPDCSRYVALTDKVYITMSIIHMHGLGRSGWVAQWRNNTLLRYLVPQEKYDYNEPKAIRPENGSYEFLQGDELRISCEYSTVNKQNNVYYGEGSDDEMCFAFLRTYPREHLKNFFSFISVGSIDMCQSSLPQYGAIDNKPNILAGCNVLKFLNELYSPHKLRFNEFCQTQHTFCRHDCKEIAKKFLDHACWQGDPYVFMKRLGFYVYEKSTMIDIDNRLAQCRIQIGREQAVEDYKRVEVEKKRYGNYSVQISLNFSVLFVMAYVILIIHNV